MTSKLFPADSFTTSDSSKGVKLRLSDADEKLYPPMTIHELFKKTVEEKPNAPALGFKTDSTSTFKIMTFMEYWNMCHNIAKSFIKVYHIFSSYTCLL
jgi:hypothetical protein